MDRDESAEHRPSGTLYGRGTPSTSLTVTGLVGLSDSELLFIIWRSLRSVGCYIPCPDPERAEQLGIADMKREQPVTVTLNDKSSPVVDPEECVARSSKETIPSLSNDGSESPSSESTEAVPAQPGAGVLRGRERGGGHVIRGRGGRGRRRGSHTVNAVPRGGNRDGSRGRGRGRGRGGTGVIIAMTAATPDNAMPRRSGRERHGTEDSRNRYVIRRGCTILNDDLRYFRLLAKLAIGSNLKRKADDMA
jgi:hypothetical protein